MGCGCEKPEQNGPGANQGKANLTSAGKPKHIKISGHQDNDICIGRGEDRVKRSPAASLFRAKGYSRGITAANWYIFLSVTKRVFVKQYWSTTTQVRILDEKEFAAAKETNPGKNFTVVVRPDYMLASDLAR